MSDNFTITAQPTVTRTQPLVEVDDLVMHFPFRGGWSKREQQFVRAVDGVSVAIQPGETLALVGESGCGKSTLGRCVLRLYEPTSGVIRFEGRDITRFSEGELRPLRQRMQLIFQDPYSALNQRLTVADTLSEPLIVHRLVSGQAQLRERVSELLNLVGLPPDAGARYPHQFSGGQRQRIVIARALALSPTFIVCDEPISALDASIQAQIVNVLRRLQRQLGLTYLFISHDLRMVRHVSDRVAVMYLGKVVEVARRDDLYDRPLHPYTRALLSAVPVPNPTVEKQRRRIILAGDVPSPVRPPRGCRFHPRCPWAQPLCTQAEPAVVEARPDQHVTCHFWREIESGQLAPTSQSRGPLLN